MDSKTPRRIPGAERPGGALDDPAAFERDLTGLSIKTRRVRAYHTTLASLKGSTPWLVAEDPWLSYARGRELTLREFSAADGVFGEPGRPAGRTLDDGATRMMTRDHVNGCALCHNVPYRDAGAGITIPKNGGTGRNTPHGFGAGLIEMIGFEGRQRLLSLVDRDDNGWVSGDEANAAPRARFDEGQSPIDFGRFDDVDGDGVPDLNPVLHLWYVDSKGKRIAWARGLHDAGVAGYGFEWQVFGHGQRDRTGHGGLSSTLRAVSANAYDIHQGLTVHDPTLNQEPSRNGLALISLSGAQQFASGTTRDRGALVDAHGRSVDDPDRDGVFHEISEGDMDLLEFHLLNHPRPAERPHEPGRRLFHQIGCVRCHVADWTLAERREGPRSSDQRLGDRRYFDLEVDFQDGDARGVLRPVRRGESVHVRGLYSDLLHHDLGPSFHEVQFDGSKITHFRTAPLWGVGTTAPYGHDGQSLDLLAVIRRHGGEATVERDAFNALSAEDRAHVLTFLNGLVLYATDRLPCDVNGDGRIDDHFVVAGVDTGRETFNPEWLFRVPARVEGLTVNAAGDPVFSYALQNRDEAYGVTLEGLVDRDRDGWPDAWVPPSVR